MSIAEILKEIPVSDEAALLGAFAAAMGYFFGGFFGFMKLPFTRRERNAEAAVNEAMAVSITTEAFEKLMSQNIETQQQLMTTTSTFTQFVMDTRKRNDDRDEQHALQVKALEKSLADAHRELKDTREQVAKLANDVQQFAIDNESKDKIIAELNRTIDSLQTSIRQLQEQAKKETAVKDKIIAEQATEISHLKTQMSGMERELVQIKAQQTQPPVEALVIAMGASDTPLKRETADVVVAPEGEAAIVEPPVNDGETQADVVPVESAGDGV